jgi:hypothetical protein
VALRSEPASVFGGHFWQWRINGNQLKKDLALMVTSHWKTLKTIENLAEKLH